VRVSVLGPVRADDGDREIDLGGPMTRALLARLALDAGRPVTVTTLVDDLWGEVVPADATGALQSLVSRARRRLPDGALGSVPGGYVLHAATDVEEFRRLQAQGRPGEALKLSRGEPFEGLGDLPFVIRTAPSLAEARLGLQEGLLQQELIAHPGSPGLVAELAELTRRYPLRERLWELYLRALVAAGRPGEALAAYETLRAMLADELGADPSPQLRELHGRILRGEADEIVCLETPHPFIAVGSYYRDFPQIEDEEVIAALDRYGGRRG
jgi:DNA-binding SARP family transcriptional activator